MSEAIKAEAERREVTRVCHFTNSANLVQILGSPEGICATRRLQRSSTAAYLPTDRQRLDGYDDHVCCSIEYPNAWYLDFSVANEKVFPDWVIIFIRPHCLWSSGTKFSPRNAAAGRGAFVEEGFESFLAMYAPAVLGAGRVERHRSTRHILACPTDDQAEVLIPENVPKSDIIGIGVRNIAQARRELSRLQQLGICSNNLSLIVAPVLFDKRTLAAAIRSGIRPKEEVWTQ